MQKILSLTALLLTASALAGGAGAPAKAPSAFRAVTCPTEIKASKCGYVKVPLDHAQPRGKQIELFVAVQKASDKVPADKLAADPLFYLEGGPGAASSPSVSVLGQVFANRDVVGIDQRGIGRSLPSLNCRALNDVMDVGDMDMTKVLPLFEKALTACTAELRSKGIKLEYFNTTQAARDVEAVRKALGYAKINLYGASYGTRLAQEVMRNSPQSLRAVVLDSVIPASIDRVAQSPLTVQQGLQRVFAACEADAACNSKYPNLEQSYRAVLKQLAAQPLKVTVDGETTPMDGNIFQGLIFNSMYFPDGLTEIPSLIKAAQQGDAKTIEGSFGLKFVQAVSDTVTWPAFFTNECMGEVAYTGPAALEKVLTEAPEFAGLLRLSPSISSPSVFRVCKTLGLTKPAPRENTAVVSPVPTLLLAGEYDPVTPPAWLSAASRGLSRSQSLVVKGASHGSGLTTECGFLSVFTFLQNPTQKVDATCAAQGKLTFK